MPRALHSLHQVFTGLYAADTRSGSALRPEIVTRRPEEETVMPNEDFCPRFVELIKAYSRRAAQKCDPPSLLF